MTYNDWVKKNWFTLVGIIVILLAVWYYAGTTLETVHTEVQKCVDHYEGQIATYCSNPGLQPYNFDAMNISYDNNN